MKTNYSVGESVEMKLPDWLMKKTALPQVVNGTIQAITSAAVMIDAKWYPLSHVEIKRPGEKFIDAMEPPAPAVQASELQPVNVTMYQPWQHQHQAFDFAYDKPGTMLYMGMGTGKTKVVIDLIQNLGLKKVLIVCPKASVATWEDEPKKHMHSSVRYTTLGLDKWTVAKKKEKAQKCLDFVEGTDMVAIVIINYASVWREPFGKWALNAGFDLIVGDESQNIKTPGAKASKWFAKANKATSKRLLLSGTPMTQSPADIFSQYRFLDPSIFGSSYWSFKSQFLLCDHMFPSKVIGIRKEMIEPFNKKFYDIAFRVGEEVLDLPEVMHERITFDLSGKTKKHYKQMSDDFYTEIGEKEVTAMHAAVKILRLQQMTGGFLKDDEGDIVEVGKEKREAFAGKLDELPIREPVVVFARFQKDLEIIRDVAEKQGRTYAELSGRRNDLKEWKDGQYDVIGVQIQAGGAGVDLTRSCYCFYYSVGHSLGDYEQSLRRSHRPGQTRTVRYYHLVANNTIDGTVYDALQKKKNVVEMVLKK